MYVNLDNDDIDRLLDACYYAKDHVPRGSKSSWNDIIRRLEIWKGQAAVTPREEARK